MPRTLTLHLSGPAEKFIDTMCSQHQLSERDVIGKALGLLQVAVETGRVALMKPTTNAQTAAIEYYYSLKAKQSEV